MNEMIFPKGGRAAAGARSSKPSSLDSPRKGAGAARFVHEWSRSKRLLRLPPVLLSRRRGAGRHAAQGAVRTQRRPGEPGAASRARAAAGTVALPFFRRIVCRLHHEESDDRNDVEDDAEDAAGAHAAFEGGRRRRAALGPVPVGGEARRTHDAVPGVVGGELPGDARLAASKTFGGCDEAKRTLVARCRPCLGHPSSGALLASMESVLSLADWARAARTVATGATA